MSLHLSVLGDQGLELTSMDADLAPEEKVRPCLAWCFSFQLTDGLMFAILVGNLKKSI